MEMDVCLRGVVWLLLCELVLSAVLSLSLEKVLRKICLAGMLRGCFAAYLDVIYETAFTSIDFIAI